MSLTEDVTLTGDRDGFVMQYLILKMFLKVLSEQKLKSV